MNGPAPGMQDAPRPRCLLLSDFNIGMLANHLAADARGADLHIEDGGFGQLTRVLADGAHAAWRTAPDCVVAWGRAQAISPGFARLAAGEACDSAGLLADVDAYAALLRSAAARCRLLLVPAWVAPESGRGRGPLEYRDGLGLEMALARMNLRLAERLRRADPDAAVRTETPEEARAVLLDLAFVPEDAIGPLIIMQSRHLDRETVEGHFRAVGGA